MRVIIEISSSEIIALVKELYFRQTEAVLAKNGASGKDQNSDQ